MALSNAVLEKIRQDTANKKSGTTANHSITASEKKSSLSQSVLDSIAMDTAFKKAGVTYSGSIAGETDIDAFFERNNNEVAAVNNWLTRYNSVVKGVTDYNTRRNGGYTTDASGGYSKDIQELMDSFDDIRGAANRLGVTEAYEQLKVLQQSIQEENDRFAAMPGMRMFARTIDANPQMDKVTETLGGISTASLMDKVKAKAQRETEWLQEYGGDSYDDLQRKLNIMDKSTDEYAWLKDFAPTVMTTQDKQKVYDQNQAQITLLEAVIKEYDGLNRNEAFWNGDSYASTRIKELNNQYGSQTELERQLEELQAANWKLGKEIAYGDVGSNADFAEKSAYVSTMDTEPDKWWEKVLDPYNPGYSDLTYEYINNQGNARNEILKYITAKGGDTVTSDIMRLKKYEDMTKDEVAAYNYLYATQGPLGAGKYLEYLNYTLNEQQMESLAESAKDMSSGFWGGLASSALSVPMSLVGGAGLLDAGFQKLQKDIQKAVTGKYAGPVDYNTAAMGGTVASSTIRNTVSKNIANVTGTIRMDESQHPTLSRLLNGKSLGDVYQLGMSMADSGAAALLSSAFGPVGTVLLGGNAGTQGMLDAVANGATDEQAIWMGVLNGGFEMLFEKVSIDNLLKGGEKNIAKAFLKQGFIEGSEETFTSIANTLADIAVMAEKSDWQKGIDAYLAQGLSQKEAEKEAFWDTCIQVAWDFVGGMFSGGIMGSAGAAIENHNAKKADSGNSQTIPNAAADQGIGMTQQTPNADPVAGFDPQSQIIRNWGGDVATQKAAQETGIKPVEGMTQTTPNVGTQQQREQMQNIQQNVNGGMQNVFGAEQTTGLTAAQSGTINGGTGDRVLPGSSQWNDGAGTGEQAGELAGSTEQAAAERQARIEQLRARNNRWRLGENLRTPKVSSQALGVQTGTQDAVLQVIPEEIWDDGLRQKAEQVYAETGKRITYVRGSILVNGTNGRVVKVRGVCTQNGIVVQVNNKVAAEQIADHEAYHGMVQEYGQGMNDRLIDRIKNTFSREAFERVLEEYIVALEGVIDVKSAKTGEEYAAAIARVAEEVLADAHAGINAFSAGANRFTDAVNRYMEESGVSRAQHQENGSRQTAGPPSAEAGHSDGDNFSVDDNDESNYDYIDNSIGVRGDPRNMPDSGREWSAFNRSFANKTADIKAGESRDILITTGDYVYDVSADGYMRGYVNKKIAITESNIQRISAIRRQVHGINRNRKTADRWIAGVRSRSGGHRGDHGVSGYGITAGGNDNIHGEPQGSYGPGNNKRNAEDTGTTELEELVLGSMFYDGENAFQVTEGESGPELKGLSLPTLDEPQDTYSVEEEPVTEDLTEESATAEKIPIEENRTATAQTELIQAIKGLSLQQMTDENLRKLIEQYTEVKTPEVKMPKVKVDKGNLKKAITSTLQLTKEQQKQLDTALEGYREAMNPPKQERKKNTDVKPVAQSKPIEAKRVLRNRMFDLFSVPSENRAELGKIIDQFADRILKSGEITDMDRREFFSRMYGSGAMEVRANEIFAEARSYLQNKRIYVNEEICRELGDEWNSVRKRAFAAGIYLTKDIRDPGVDVWNQNLAEDIPGLFVAEDTDMRVILERILHVAEEGKNEKVSLAEYTAMLAEREYVPESELLDAMEQRMDWILSTFAENARLEIKLKDRTGRVIANEREKNRLAAEQKREQKQLAELRRKTLNKLQWLRKNRRKASVELQTQINELISDIDLLAQGAANAMNWSSKYQATWEDLAQMYEDAKQDPNFIECAELDSIVERLKGKKLADMDVGMLENLYKMATGLQHMIQYRNQLINDEQNRYFSDVSRTARTEIKAAGKGYTGSKVSKYFNDWQLTPMNFLQRLAGWKPDSAIMDMAKQLVKAQEQERRYKLEAKKRLNQFIEDNKSWLAKADGQGKNGIWYEITVPKLLSWDFRNGTRYGDDVTLSITPLQKVSLYLMSQGFDNMKHSQYGGILFPDKQLYSKGERWEAFAASEPIRLSTVTIKSITSDLTETEMELANILKEYYNQFAPTEINKMSNMAYGYDKAMGGYYYPIWVVEDFVEYQIAKGEDGKAENIGSLKERKQGTNAMYLVSCLEQVEKHIDETARACAMTIPTRNWTGFINWTDHAVWGSGENSENLKSVIKRAWGKGAFDYIDKLLNNMQRPVAEKTDELSAIISKLNSKHIGATFAFNFKIMAKQLGSISMAAPYLGIRNYPVIKEFAIGSKTKALISKYTPDLEWRSLGYSVPEIRMITENPTGFQKIAQRNRFTKFFFAGGQITVTDSYAASVLWPWAENYVRKTFKDLEMGTQEQIDAGQSPFYQKVAEVFNDTVARSQSTTEELFQSEIRKSKNPLTRTFTLFKSDSAQSYNVLRQKLGEAQYYHKVKDKPNFRKAAWQSAKAILATVTNSLWATGVNIAFAAILWGGKGYKDDEEDKITWESALSGIAEELVQSMAGVTILGEEIASMICNVVTGEKLYDFEAPGMEQVNNIFSTADSLLSGGKDFTEGLVDIMQNEGDVKTYIQEKQGEFIGVLADTAELLAAFCDIPASNIRRYLITPIANLIPGLNEEVEDLVSTPERAMLEGMEGVGLEIRIENILGSRNIAASEAMIETLAGLCAEGHTEAVPSSTPDTITIDEVSHKLSAYQQQTFDDVWGDIVGGNLDGVISNQNFTGADTETQVRMLSKLYTYATAQAKKALFPNYALADEVKALDELVHAGYSVSEAVIWKVETSETSNAEKFAVLLNWDVDDTVKENVIATITGTDMQTEKGNPTEYARFRSLLEDGMTADQYMQMRILNYKSEDALEMTEAGLNGQQVLDYAQALDKIEPEPGEDTLDALQKWRACVDFSSNESIQIAALAGEMNDSQFTKFQIAYDHGVTPDGYVTFKETLPKFDADGNGSYKQEEIQAALDSMGDIYTKEQKAILWQLTTSAKSSKNNPYSTSIGQQVIDAREAAKANQAPETFEEAIMKQWAE